MIISEKKYFEQYENVIGKNIESLNQEFIFINTNTDVHYHTQVSAVFSSNIEGNTIDLNSFMNYSLSKELYKPNKEILEIEDLITAYAFAQNEKLNEKNLLLAHKTLSKQLLITSLCGKYRQEKVGVFGASGLIYLALDEELVPQEMKDFFKEIEFILSNKVTLSEAFYFASLIHLRFVHIHPFRDGNGRAARLLEKWFLAQCLGDKYWTVPSEKYYKEYQGEYYKNINLGVNFYELDYDKCLPFLTMLSKSLEQ